MTMSERRGTGDGQRQQSRGNAPKPAKNPTRGPANSPAGSDTPQQGEDRTVRRAVFLAELAEAKELRKREIGRAHV